MAKIGFFRRLINKINKIYTKAIIIGGRILYRRTNAKLLGLHPHKSFNGEQSFIDLWHPLSKKPDIKAYRLFAQYIGEQPEIVPEDISSGIIHPLLNPIQFRPFYKDKNCFEIILGSESLPKTLVRSMMGKILDSEYQAINDVDDYLVETLKEENRVFLKPATDTSSGQGVIGFERTVNGKMRSLDDTTELNFSFLLSYGKNHPDWILQRGLSQHPDISLFNPTSINTIRVATYRSVEDNKTHYLRAIIRIGKKGSFVDNAHAGGYFVGIDENGKLGKYACDQYGNRYEEFNGINFELNDYYIPHFDTIKSFVEEQGDKIHHARLIAFDICLEANGKPKVVEFNMGAFAPWLFQFTSGTAFGPYTKEIITYCSKNKNRVNKVLVEPF